MPSRRLLLGAAGALALPGLARAQGRGPDGWPNGRSVSLVLPFTPGGGTDVVARVLIDGFTETFGGSFVMEHKPGATTTVGARHVARARPDGLTLFLGSNSAFAQAPYAYRNLGYDPLKDFSHISLLFASAYLLVANPKWQNFGQMVEAARKAPNTVTYGTWGVGSTAHLLMLDLASRTGTELLHVPFNGPAPALTEILAGRVDMMFTTFAPARAHVLEGRLRALATPHEERLKAVPDVPTTAEVGLQDLIVSAWWCLAGPAGLSPALIAALDQGVRSAVVRPAAQKPIEDFGLLPLPLGPEAFVARTKKDLALNADLMRRAGIVPE